MKSVWIWSLLLFLASDNAHAIANRVFAPTPAAPITGSYATTSVQLMSEIGTNTHLIINNQTSSDLACLVSIGGPATQVPVENGSRMISEPVVISPTTVLTFLELRPSQNIWCRAYSSTPIISGKVYLHAW